MKISKQCTLFEFDGFLQKKRRNGKARIPSLLVVRRTCVKFCYWWRNANALPLGVNSGLLGL